MPQQFSISASSATREEWGWLVLLGSVEQMDGQPYLMVQSAHESSADDVRLGQNRPYIEINNQGWSWYGHIARFELHRDRVFIQMDQDARALMENDGAFTFYFSLSDGAFAEVKAILGRIFESSSFYASSAAP